jgi:predicted MPP superfamily phosphohydrolase
MQVSGHTHAGQLFPLRLLYALIGGTVYGEYKTSASTLIVSAGAGGWRDPLRTDAHCNFEVITLKPSE